MGTRTNMGIAARSLLSRPNCHFHFSAVQDVLKGVPQPDQVAAPHGQPRRRAGAEEVQVLGVPESLQIQASPQGQFTSYSIFFRHLFRKEMHMLFNILINPPSNFRNTSESTRGRSPSTASIAERDSPTRAPSPRTLRAKSAW